MKNSIIKFLSEVRTHVYMLKYDSDWIPTSLRVQWNNTAVTDFQDKEINLTNYWNFHQEFVLRLFIILYLFKTYYCERDAELLNFWLIDKRSVRSPFTPPRSWDSILVSKRAREDVVHKNVSAKNTCWHAGWVSADTQPLCYNRRIIIWNQRLKRSCGKELYMNRNMFTHREHA